MGLFGLYVALAAAGVGGQVSPPMVAGAAVPSNAAAQPFAMPIDYRLPVMVKPIEDRREAAEKYRPLTRIVPPAMPQEPFGLPTAKVWRDGYVVNTNPVGVRLAWNL